MYAARSAAPAAASHGRQRTGLQLRVSPSKPCSARPPTHTNTHACRHKTFGFPGGFVCLPAAAARETHRIRRESGGTSQSRTRSGRWREAFCGCAGSEKYYFTNSAKVDRRPAPPRPPASLLHCCTSTRASPSTTRLVVATMPSATEQPPRDRDTPSVQPAAPDRVLVNRTSVYLLYLLRNCTQNLSISTRQAMLTGPKKTE